MEEKRPVSRAVSVEVESYKKTSIIDFVMHACLYSVLRTVEPVKLPPCV
jgi:hypothetical protein